VIMVHRDGLICTVRWGASCFRVNSLLVVCGGVLLLLRKFFCSANWCLFFGDSLSALEFGERSRLTKLYLVVTWRLRLNSVPWMLSNL